MFTQHCACMFIPTVNTGIGRRNYKRSASPKDEASFQRLHNRIAPSPLKRNVYRRRTLLDVASLTTARTLGRRGKLVFAWCLSFTLFLFVLLHRHVGDTPFLEFRRRYQARGTRRVVLLRLPPIVIILADNLQDVASLERDPGLRARDQLVLQRIVIELRSNENLLA